MTARAGDRIYGVTGSPYMSRLRRRRRGYERSRRHVRCDRCLRDYLPQHVDRWRWRWECGNCTSQQGRGIPVMSYPPQLKRALNRHRYRDEPDMLRALGLEPAPAGDGGSEPKEVGQSDASS